MPTYTRTGEGPASVADIYGHQVEVNPGESVQTYKILGTGWTKTSDEPYYELGYVQSETSPGSISGLLGYKYLQVTTEGSDVVITANAATNPNGYQLQADVAFVLSNDGVIDELHFTGSGTVTVIGLKR